MSCTEWILKTHQNRLSSEDMEEMKAIINRQFGAPLTKYYGRSIADSFQNRPQNTRQLKKPEPIRTLIMKAIVQIKSKMP